MVSTRPSWSASAGVASGSTRCSSARIVASDLPGNPSDQALESELTSRQFVIANTAPAIEIGAVSSEGGKLSAPVSVRCHGATLFQLDFRLDSRDEVERWHRRLMMAKVAVLDPPGTLPSGEFALHAADPEGNVLCLFAS